MKKSLPLQLYAGIALAVIIVLLVAIFTIVSLEKQEEEAAWVTHTIQVLQKTRDIRYQLLQMRGARRAYWITGRENFLDYYNNGNSTIPNMVHDLHNLVADNAQQTINTSKLDSAISSLFTFWDGSGKLDPRQPKETLAAITLQEENKLNQIYGLFEIVKAEEQRLLAIREEALKKRNNLTRTFIIGGISILMVIVLILVNAVIATLKSRIRAGNRLQASLQEMEKVHAVAEEKNWVLTGVATITAQIQSVDGTNNLSQDIIDAVVNYMELPAGALYIADEKQNLTMAAAVAVSSAAKTGFEKGVGIVGNAALKREISITRNIPADYWRIESATGTTSGKGEIACIPLWVAENLKGVIELGSLHEFQPKQLMLLEAISSTLATSIHTRQSRLRINKLLEQVQEQKEAMVSQQEELRQTNEELSRQTEELQASEEELKTQEEELRQINTELIEKNETVENARQALILKSRELEATSKYKSEFLANMSHELRTPLNSVLILAKLLADNKPANLNPKQIEYAKIIHKSGTDLLQLINDILDLSKIEAGKVELFVEEVSIDGIVNDLNQLFTIVAAEKEIRFETQLGENIPKVLHTDKQRVEQVLKNLLSNAFKFTPKDGSVTLSFTNRDLFGKQRIGISVSDSGIGISKPQQQLIFEAFQQADGSTSRQYGGTGLGLSISRELVRLLGGEIEIQSEEGKGSVFTIILPHVLEVESMPSTASAAPLPEVAAFNDFTEQEKVEDDRKVFGESDKTILIIEDDVNFATILKDFARDKGYKVMVALKGDEGLAYAKRYRPDAIILDIQLPVIDGWSLLRMFKADEQLKNIPVHVISAFDDNRLYTAGALAYVKKPVDREGLEKAFSRIGVYLSEHIKKVLIVSASHFRDDSLRQLFRQKHHDTDFEQVSGIEEAREKLRAEKFGCLIADIGTDVSAGIGNLQHLQEELKNQSIPVIIYLDTDISPADELQLKKISDVIVRNSPSVNSRLKDELELFLFKVQESDAKQETRTAVPPVNDRSLAGKKILVVDDDMRNVFALSNVLENQDMVVVPAADGRESLAILEKDRSIDLVLMDIMMPEMDGYEAIQAIRKKLQLVKLPIIALTAKAMSGDREKCIEAGASDYITKPVDTQKLISLMRVWLST
ncbi:MAG: response regulator [Chitinophagaceae bacterium]|nr:response regulator [Chitinophagaceae bacterium]